MSSEKPRYVQQTPVYVFPGATMQIHLSNMQTCSEFSMIGAAMPPGGDGGHYCRPGTSNTQVACSPCTSPGCGRGPRLFPPATPNHSGLYERPACTTLALRPLSKVICLCTS
jgi:hypothetical protein